MFDNSQIDGLLQELSAYDFAATSLDDYGASRIDAIAAYDRVIRSAQARQAGQIAALYAERSLQMSLGRGDAALSVIGEVGMARNVSPCAAGSQFTLALGMRDLPQVAGLFASGVISENAARAVVRESAALGADDLVVLDAELAPRLTGLTATRAARVTRYAVILIDAEAARSRAKANRADQRVTMFPETDGVATLHVRGPADSPKHSVQGGAPNHCCVQCPRRVGSGTTFSRRCTHLGSDNVPNPRRARHRRRSC